MVNLVLTAKQKRRIWTHLIPRNHEVEEAAFLFVREELTKRNDLLLVCQDIWLLAPEDFSYQSNCHIEVADEARGKLIKRAHDMQATVVEMHSHLGDWSARFSKSDLMGFDEWVPHIRWRLKGKPYAAIVVTGSDFDGFVWRSDGPERLNAIKSGTRRTLQPNGRSPLPGQFQSENDYGA